MNSPELGHKEEEIKGREIMVSGEALEKAIWCLKNWEKILTLLGCLWRVLGSWFLSISKRHFKPRLEKKETTTLKSPKLSCG